MRGIITAFRTLTIIPLPGPDAADMAQALPYFPLAGAALGGIVAVAAWAVSAKLGLTIIAGALGCALAALLTRGLHLDGRGDAADAIGGGHTRERRLEIMKDPHIGAFGVIAIATVLLLKAAAITELASMTAWRWIAVAFVISRTIQVELVVALPYARREGGTAGPFVQNAKPLHLAVATVLAAACCVAFAGLAALAVLAAALVAAVAWIAWMKAAFGGVTGDLIGMASEISETLLLVILAAAGPLLCDVFGLLVGIVD